MWSGPLSAVERDGRFRAPELGLTDRGGRKADYEAVGGASEPIVSPRKELVPLLTISAIQPGDHIFEGVHFRRERQAVWIDGTERNLS